MPASVEYYIHAFQHMNRASLCGYKAPHKPILLLCMMDMVEDGTLTANRIELSDELIWRFNNKWKLLVDDGTSMNIDLNDISIQTKGKYPFKCSIEKPFFHLNHEPFWQLVQSDLYETKNDYSISSLRKSFQYATVDETLFQLLLQEDSRNKLKTVLESLI